MTEKKTVIIIHETMWKSWLSDAGTISMAFILIGIGRLLDSSPMAWSGFVVFILFIFARASIAPNTHHYTPQEAADFLAEKWNVRTRL